MEDYKSVSDDYDYLIVGAGASGCVLASRLVRYGLRVLLIEDGPKNARSRPVVRYCDEWANALLCGWPVTHALKTSPQSNLNNRRIPLGIGRGCGGSTLINAGIYQRGREEDYFDWPWDTAFIELGFKSIEDELNPELQDASAVGNAIIKMVSQCGFTAHPNSNKIDWTRDGVKSDMHFSTRNGRRLSAWDAFITPILHMPNFAVLENHRVVRIITNEYVVTGVEVIRLAKSTKSSTKSIQEGQKLLLSLSSPSAEVILCCGAVFTPQILMLSGIGPKSHLQSLGIPVVHDLPGIGSNLQDHLLVGTANTSKRKITNGMCSHQGLQALADWRVNTGGHESFLQFLILDNSKMYKMAAFLGSWSGIHTRNGGKLSAFLQCLMMLTIQFILFIFPPMKNMIRQTLTSLVILTGPTSRGTVRLSSSDPSVPPIVDPQYMATIEDQAAIRAAFIQFRKVQGSQEGQIWYGAEILPGRLYSYADSEADFQMWLKDYSMSYFHLCGSCAIGDVLDEKLRVRGISKLRVADASIAPKIPTAPTQAMSMMIGDRSAALIMLDRAKSSL